MKLAPIIVGVLAILTIYVPTPAAAVAPGCTTDGSAISIGGTFYISNKSGPSIYEESNHDAGLQHGGANSLAGGILLGPDVYPGCSSPDTIVF